MCLDCLNKLFNFPSENSGCSDFSDCFDFIGNILLTSLFIKLQCQKARQRFLQKFFVNPCCASKNLEVQMIVVNCGSLRCVLKIFEC